MIFVKKDMTCIKKLEFSDSCKSNSLKFHPVKQKNNKSLK